MMGKMLLLFKFPCPGYKEGCPLQVELVYSCSVLVNVELQLDYSTLYGLHVAGSIVLGCAIMSVYSALPVIPANYSPVLISLGLIGNTLRPLRPLGPLNFY